MSPFQKFQDNLPNGVTAMQGKYHRGKVCCIKKCRKKKAVINREGKKSVLSTCFSCRQMIYKLRHPMRYYFNTTRQNAKRRKKPFTLSFAEYCALWHKSGRLPHVKSDGKAWTIDRIDSSKGYEVGNVRIVDFITNSSRILETNPEEAKILGLDFHIVCVKGGVSKTVIGEMDKELQAYLCEEYANGEPKQDTGKEESQNKESEALNLPF